MRRITEKINTGVLHLISMTEAVTWVEEHHLGIKWASAADGFPNG